MSRKRNLSSSILFAPAEVKEEIEELVELAQPVEETKVDAESKPKQFIKVRKTPFMEHFKNDMLLIR